MLWKCKVPDKVVLHLSIQTWWWVNLGLQNELYVSYIVGDLVMQQQTLWISCVVVSCVVLRIKNEKVVCLHKSMMHG